MTRFLSHTRILTVLAAPVMLQNFAFSAILFTDTVMVGHISLVALGAMGMATWLLAPLHGLAKGFAIALRPLVGQRFGAGQRAEIGACVRQAFWISQAVCWLLVLAYWLVRSYVSVLPIDPRLLPITAEYLDILIWGLPPMGGFLALRFAIHGVGYTKIDGVTSIVAFSVNLVLNWALMYGHLGLPELGVMGCAWSTMITFWLLPVTIIAYMQLRPAIFSSLSMDYRIAIPTRVNPEIAREVVDLGLPTGVTGLFCVGLFTIVAIVAAMLGAEIAALHQILKSLNSLLVQFWQSLRAAVNIVVSQAVGARDALGARQKGHSAYLFTKSLYIIFAVVVFIAWQPAVHFYTSGAAETDLLNSAWPVFLLYVIFDSMHLVSLGVVRGYKDVRVPMFMAMFAYYGVGLPLVCVGVFRWEMGLQWIWFSMAMMMAVYSSLLFIRFRLISGRAIFAQRQAVRVPS